MPRPDHALDRRVRHGRPAGSPGIAARLRPAPAGLTGGCGEGRRERRATWVDGGAARRVAGCRAVRTERRPGERRGAGRRAIVWTGAGDRRAGPAVGRPRPGPHPHALGAGRPLLDRRDDRPVGRGRHPCGDRVARAGNGQPRGGRRAESDVARPHRSVAVDRPAEGQCDGALPRPGGGTGRCRAPGRPDDRSRRAGSHPRRDDRRGSGGRDAADPRRTAAQGRRRPSRPPAALRDRAAPRGRGGLGTGRRGHGGRGGRPATARRIVVTAGGRQRRAGGRGAVARGHRIRRRVRARRGSRRRPPAATASCS